MPVVSNCAGLYTTKPGAPGTLSPELLPKELVQADGL